MDDSNPNPTPNDPLHASTTPPAEPHHEAPVGTRRVKRRLMYGLLGLYGASVLAACILLARGQTAPPPSKKGEKGAAAGGLLSLSQSGESVGWISIHGAIYSSESGKPWEKGAEQWARKLKELSETKGVKAIVLDINSPGGSVGAVQELYSQIQRVRAEKHIPIVALFGDISASGGYYIAAACDQIVAHPGTLTGSIGVIFSVSNMEELFKKIGYKQDPIKSGKHKDIGSPARPMTAEERKIMQDLIDDAYDQFLTAVANGRKLPKETVRPLADGRIFSGNQALTLHLVDKLGDSTDAIELAGKLGGIQGRPKVRRDGEHFSDLFDMFESKFSGRLDAASPVSILESLKPHAGLEYRWAGW